MKNLDVLVGAKDVELVAFREHSYRKGCEVIKHVGEIKTMIQWYMIVKENVYYS